MLGRRHFFRSVFFVVAIALVAISLGSCGMAKNQMDYDRSAERTVQDYRDGLAPQPLPPQEITAAPDFQPIVSLPADLKLPTPLVSISVNQGVALSDLLFEMTEQAGVDLELDSQISGSLIFTAKERPFSEVVERICDMAGLRYTFQNNVLRVEVDRPYVKNYKVDYMNNGRKSDSSIGSNLSVSGGGENVSSGTSSSANISSKFESNLWKEIDTGLKQVLAASDAYTSLTSPFNPASTAMTTPGGASNTPPPLPAGGGGEAAPPLVLPVPPATYSISKESGLVSVFASQRQHKLVRQFLEDFRRIATMQVLIEAKVLEVALTDEFSVGIDWGNFANVTGGEFINAAGMVALKANLAAPDLSPPSTNSFTAKIGLPGTDGVQPIISALSRFGTVRALSSPRVTVMNSQPAVVNVTNNSIYFDITTTTVPATVVGVPPTITKTATVKSAPEGVLMNVLPTANPDTGEILLSVRPSVSKVTRQIPDPINAGNLVPELSVQEIDSVVKIQSGQTMVMGGLMKDGAVISREGVPILDGLPVLGALFRNHADKLQKNELVILLKATIVPSADATGTDVDRKIFKDFGQDRRPARL